MVGVTGLPDTGIGGENVSVPLAAAQNVPPAAPAGNAANPTGNSTATASRTTANLRIPNLLTPHPRRRAQDANAGPPIPNGDLVAVNHRLGSAHTSSVLARHFFTHHLACDLRHPGHMEPFLDEARATTSRAVTLPNETDSHSDSHVPQAAVLPPPPTNLADVLRAAVERLEAFLEDVYVNGRSIGDPTAIWANGVPYRLHEILDNFPLQRVTVD